MVMTGKKNEEKENEEKKEQGRMVRWKPMKRKTKRIR